MDEETKERVLINVDRIEEILNDKDEKIEELERKLHAFEQRDKLARNEDEWVWTEHFLLEEDDTPELPIPRIQLQWEFIGDRHYQSRCWTFLVFKHLIGDIVKVPLGMTRVSGGRQDEFYPKHPDGPRIGTPFRAGGDAATEARQLRLPLFVTQEGMAQELFPDDKGPGFEHGPIFEIARTTDE